MNVDTTQVVRHRPVTLPASAGERHPQVRPGLRIALVLSAIVAVLMGAASAAGLFVSHLYRDGAWAREALRGGDLVTLLITLPILTAAIVLSIRGSQRAGAVWIGVLAYAVYNYAYYAFGTAFNDAFLFHIALLSTSIFALVFALPNLDSAAIAERLYNPRRARWIGGFLVIVGVLQGALWLFVVSRNAVTGEVLHDIPVAGQHLVFALDLALLVPSLVVAGVLLWRQTPMGYVLGAAMCVMGALYQFNLMMAGVFQANADVAGVKAFPPEGLFLTAGFVVSALLLLFGRGTRVRGAGERRTTMRLTRRDGVATVMAGLVAAIALAVTRSWDWPMLGSYRAGVAAVGVIGWSMCIVGSSRTTYSFKGPFVVFASALGGLALLLVIVGLVTGTETPFLLLAVVIEILWLATTLRHAVSARHVGPRRHAALA